MIKYKIHSIAAMTVVVAFTVAACAPDSQSTSEPVPDTPAVARTAETGTMFVNEGNGLYRFAIHTVNAAAVPATVDGPASGGSADGPARDVHDLEITVHRLDGTTETVTIPNESLVVAAPRADEQPALAAAGPGAVIVVDVSGLAGPAGARYLLAGDTITELDGGPAGGSGEGSTVAPTLATEPVASAVPTEPDVQVVVATTDTQIADAIAAIEGVVAVTTDGPGALVVTAELDATAIGAAIEAVAGVTDVREIVPIYPTGDSRQGEQWSLSNTGSTSQMGLSNAYAGGIAGDDIAAPAAWTVTRGSGIVVAVIDSGVDRTHVDLASQMWTNTDEICGNGTDDDHNGFKDDCNGWDFAGGGGYSNGGDNNPNPDAGSVVANHGTHVAGIIAAAQNSVGIVGVAPEAKIMALKVFGPNYESDLTWSTRAIDYAVANGANVINMSLGTTPGQIARTNPVIVDLQAAITRAAAQGVVVVASAGNNGIDISNVGIWPASLSVFIPGMVTVGASTNSDTRASFSNFGTPVNLLAPGYFNLSSIPGDAWAFMSGTSMAAPTVAGAVALVMASGTAVAPAEVRSRLVATTDQTAAGRRLNAAVAVGTDRSSGVPPALSVAYSGVTSLAPNADGSIGIDVQAAANTSVSQIRLSVATREGGAVAAVQGLSATFSDTSGAITTGTTSDIGAFPAVPLRDPSALNGPGMTVTASGINLPAGEYAFVTELLNGSGTAVGGAQVAYVTIADQPVSDPGPGTTTATTVAASPILPMPTTPTTAPAGGSQTTAPATTTAAGGGTGTTAPVTTAPAGSGGAGTTSPATTSPTGSGGAAPPTTAPGPTVPGTTTPAGTVPATTTLKPSTTNPSTTDPATTAPRGTTVTTTPAPTTPAPTTPAPTTPAPTTPAPPPVTDGVYRATAMQPRLAPLCGGTSHIIDGWFPTNVPIYVWFGSAVAKADVTTTRLTVTAPAVAAEGVVEVTIKFTADRQYRLLLANAFTFHGSCATPRDGGTGTTLPAPAPVPTVPSGGGTGTTTPATVPAPKVPSGGGTGTTTPATAPATTRPPATAPVITQPATTAPAATIPDVGLIGSRGALTLRRLPATGAIAALSASGWPPAGCRQSLCGAARI